MKTEEIAKLSAEIFVGVFSIGLFACTLIGFYWLMDNFWNEFLMGAGFFAVLLFGWLIFTGAIEAWKQHKSG